MVWMEAKQGAQDCMLLETSFDLTKGEKQKKLSFPQQVKTEVVIEHWICGFRFGTQDDSLRECDCWASNVTSKGFTANVNGSSNAERIDVTWIVYKKGKRKVASGTFSTADIEVRDEGEAENTGKVDFPHAAFTSTPTVLVGFSQFEMAGGRDLKLLVRTTGASSTGFTWHLSM